MKSKDEMVTELWNREAIRDLPVRYCDCVWQNDIKGIVDLFSEDATFVVKGREREAVSHGRAELLKMYERAFKDLSPRPYIHNHVVELSGPNKAVGRCYVELRNVSKGMEWIGSGYYEDEYVKLGDQWKFFSRKFTGVGMPRG